MWDASLPETAEGGEPRPKRARVVRRSHIAAQIEGTGDQCCGLFFPKGMRRRGKENAVDAVSIHPGQAVCGRGDRHRDTVLVVPRDGFFRATFLDRTPGEVGEGKASGGDVGAQGGDASHCDVYFSGAFTPS